MKTRKTRKTNKIALLDIPFSIAVFVYCIYSFRTAVQQYGLQEMIYRDNGELAMMVVGFVLPVGSLIFDLLCLLSDKDKQGYNHAFVIIAFIAKIMIVLCMIMYKLVG